jgi:hypothetical protein
MPSFRLHKKKEKTGLEYYELAITKDNRIKFLKKSAEKNYLPAIHDLVTHYTNLNNIRKKHKYIINGLLLNCSCCMYNMAEILCNTNVIPDNIEKLYSKFNVDSADILSYVLFSRSINYGSVLFADKYDKQYCIGYIVISDTIKKLMEIFNTYQNSDIFNLISYLSNFFLKYPNIVDNIDVKTLLTYKNKVEGYALNMIYLNYIRLSIICEESDIVAQYLESLGYNQWIYQSLVIYYYNTYNIENALRCIKILQNNNANVFNHILCNIYLYLGNLDEMLNIINVKDRHVQHILARYYYDVNEELFVNHAILAIKYSKINQKYTSHIPGCHLVNVLLVNYYKKIGDYNKFIDTIITSINNGCDIFMPDLVDYYLDRDVERAIHILNTAQKEDKCRYDHRDLLVKCYHKIGDYDNALKYCDEDKLDINVDNVVRRALFYKIKGDTISLKRLVRKYVNNIKVSSLIKPIMAELYEPDSINYLYFKYKEIPDN